MLGCICVIRQLFFFVWGRFKGHDDFFVSNRWDTVPNAVTCIGIFLIPAYMLCFMTRSWTFFIPIISTGIILSDILDGWIADRLDQHSRIGKFIDPLRDRLYLGAVFLNFFFLSVPNIIIPVVVLAVTEAAIAINRFLKYRYNIPHAHWVGKLRMAVQSICANILLVQEYWLVHHYINALLLLWIMTLVSVIVLLVYTFDRVKMSAFARSY